MTTQVIDSKQNELRQKPAKRHSLSQIQTVSFPVGEGFSIGALDVGPCSPNAKKRNQAFDKARLA
jgi:hypothetical protein